jgi:hypothetical protein
MMRILAVMLRLSTLYRPKKFESSVGVVYWLLQSCLRAYGSGCGDVDLHNTSRCPKLNYRSILMFV